MRKILVLGIVLVITFSCKTKKEQQENTAEEMAQERVETPEAITIVPIEHATAVVEWNDTVIYIDPVGGKTAFEGQDDPDLILITDIHGDHLSIETLEELNTENATLIVPQAVADKIPAEAALRQAIAILGNGESKTFSEVTVEAIPMYNLREEAKDFHVKGRGNGYVITLGDKRIYFSGDTEDIPEMRALENIDKAFVCMNLPYTMTVESAVDAVLEFQPKEVYPYHFRGRPEVSDVTKFKQLVNEGNPDIRVVQLDWYPNDEF